MPDLDISTAYRLAMRRLAATVTIITTVDDDVPHGMTATAVASVSTEPPAILFCVNKSASLHAPLKRGSQICINLLHTDHAELSRVFSGKMDGPDRFTVGAWSRDAVGVPYLSDAQANIFCTADLLTDYGTHTICIAKVTGALSREQIAPLVYQDGYYASSSPLG